MSKLYFQIYVQLSKLLASDILKAITKWTILKAAIAKCNAITTYVINTFILPLRKQVLFPKLCVIVNAIVKTDVKSNVIANAIVKPIAIVIVKPIAIVNANTIIVTD